MVRIKILITSIGSNTAINVVKMLRTSKIGNFDPYIIGTDIYDFKCSAGAQLVDQFFQIAPANKPDQCCRDILEIVGEQKVNCVIPIHDDELVVVAELAQIKPKLTFWAVNTPEIIDICNNKTSSNEIAESLGIKTPTAFNEAVLSTLDARSFPLIAKPNRGVSSRGHFIIRDHVDLDYFLKKIYKKSYLIQSYIEEAIEYTVDCYSNSSGKFMGGLARERIETRSGLSIKSKTVNVPKMTELCQIFLDQIGYRGVSNLQFLSRNGNFYFIEINPRFAGGGVLSYRSGLNAPELTLREAMGFSIDARRIVNNLTYGTFMVRYYTEIYHEAESHNI